MAKQSNQKLKLLYLLRILLEQTDENSGLTIAQISAELAKYNVSAARKSLYDDIEALRLFGIEVSIKRDRYVKYYIAKRDLSSAELKYAVDALATFEAIPKSASYELMQKLVRMFGGRGKAYLGVLEEPDYKTPKAVYDDIAKSIELLESAIGSGKKIYCKRFEWNSLKQRALLDGGKKICLTPIKVYCDGKYVLQAYDGKAIVNYDVSALIEVEISSESAAPLSEYNHILEDLKYNFEYENLRLEFSSSFAGDVFRKFGLGVTVLSSREECFEISVKTRLDGELFSWLFQNAKHVRIISPMRAIDAYRDRLLLALDNINKN